MKTLLNGKVYISEVRAKVAEPKDSDWCYMSDEEVKVDPKIVSKEGASQPLAGKSTSP